MAEQTSHMINGINTIGLKKTIGKMKTNPALAECEFRCRNEWVEGDENHADIYDFYAAGSEQTHQKTFRIQSGEHALLEGHDRAAGPAELLLSSLSSCMTGAIVYYAALNGYTIKKLESTFKGKLNLRGFMNLDPKTRPGYQAIHIEFKIQTDAPIEALKTYYHFSPVYDVVSKSVPIHVEIHRDIS